MPKMTTRLPTIAIDRPLYDKLTERAVGEKTTLIQYTNDLLMMFMERDDVMALYFPQLEKIGFHNNELLIKNNKLNQIFQVYKKDKKIYCENDESFDCIHTQFALSLLEIGKLTE